MDHAMPFVIAAFFYTLAGALALCVVGLIGLSTAYAGAFVVCVVRDLRNDEARIPARTERSS